MNDSTDTVELTATEKSLIEQLTENTGRALLDSGDAYGRAWERNQGRDFKSEESSVLSVRNGSIDVTHNVFHWLAERVEYQPDLDALFETWARAEKGNVATSGYSGAYQTTRANLPWLQSAENFVGVDIEPGDDLLDYPLAGIAKGIYGDGKPLVNNTYNGEDLLSQTLQYVYFTLEEDVTLLKREHEETGLDLIVVDPEDYDGQEADLVVWPSGEYVLLQIHGGCDVRGGYTRARVHTCSIEDGPSILDNARAELYCLGTDGNGSGGFTGQLEIDGKEHFEEPHRWYTDDGYHWYNDSGLPELTRDTVVFVDTEAERLEADGGTFVGVEETGTLHCPICTGKVTASSY